MIYLWRYLCKPTWKKKSRKVSSGYSRKRRPAKTVTVTVEIIDQTEKAIEIKNDQLETAWIPKYWVIEKKVISEHTWEIVIKKQQWEEKFSGKLTERLSPRSNYSEGKQKIDLTPTPTVTATVEIVRQSDKAILIKNERGETAWIPKYWVIKKKEISNNTWQIKIKKQQWEEKFSGKPEEKLRSRS